MSFVSKVSGNQGFGFLELSDDSILHVFGQLGPKDLINCNFVHTRFYKLIEHGGLWQKLCPAGTVKSKKIRFYKELAVKCARKQGNTYVNDRQLGNFNQLVYSLALYKGQVITGSTGNILFWDPQKNERTNKLKGHKGRVLCLDVSEMIFSGSDDKTVRVWNPDEKKQTTVLNIGSPVSSLKVQNGKAFMASQKCVKVWDVRAEAELLSFLAKENVVQVAISGDNLARVAGKTMAIYDARAGKKCFKYGNPNEEGLNFPTSVEFIDPERVITGNLHGNITVYDLRKPNESVTHNRRLPAKLSKEDLTGSITDLKILDEGVYTVETGERFARWEHTGEFVITAAPWNKPKQANEKKLERLSLAVGEDSVFVTMKKGGVMGRYFGNRAADITEAEITRKKSKKKKGIFSCLPWQKSTVKT